MGILGTFPIVITSQPPEDNRKSEGFHNLITKIAKEKYLDLKSF